MYGLWAEACHLFLGCLGYGKLQSEVTVFWYPCASASVAFLFLCHAFFCLVAKYEMLY